MEFLEDVSKHYEIVAFSSAEKRLIDWIVSKIDPSQEYFSATFSGDDVSMYQHNESCCGSRGDEGSVLMLVKNITGFFSGPHPRRRQRVVCVDDQVGCFVYNLRNLVPIRKYDGDAEDDELLELRTFLVSTVKARDARDEISKRCDLLADLGLE